MTKIEGGFYLKARCIQNSRIAHAPPHVREIWDWLIKEANHKDVKGFKRGQMLRSIQDIRDGLSWHVGYRKETYSKSQCEFALNWLRSETMIETMKTTRGMIITVLKYAIYQEPKNYESNTNGHTSSTRLEQHPDTINKNEKNDKEERMIKEKIYKKENSEKTEDPVFNAFLKLCESKHIQVDIKSKRYLELRDEFTTKVNWWHEITNCVNWCYDKGLKKINAIRLRNWMVNSVKFQKLKEVKTLAHFEDKNAQKLRTILPTKLPPVWKAPS